MFYLWGHNVYGQSCGRTMFMANHVGEQCLWPIMRAKNVRPYNYILIFYKFARLFCVQFFLFFYNNL